ncbi:ATP-dependent DNA helicase RecG [Candidatus Velamenicoccus archaeovorus]|uniref:ATP-dependent DNA helicase RecG n=1 Tax=Velamenicoccus archaeovorus TaxID=1930593 RepID=A0A410P737_VELA1|nr:ATP-dependent DNA helicase RecG [Candidatus Velamenicoccus archaeovorus]
MPILSSPVQYLKGIGPKRAQDLGRTGINLLEDLLYYFPRRYEDRSQFKPIGSVDIGSTVTVKGEVISKKGRPAYLRRGIDIFEISVADGTGRIFAVWFNQPFLHKYFNVGDQVILYGKADLYRDKIQMSSPDFEIIEDKEAGLDVGRIVPIYRLPQGFSQRVLRKLIKSVLESQITRLQELLPYDVRARHSLLNIAQSLLNIHFPQNEKMRLRAYQRLAFEEFFLYQIPLILRKLKRRDKAGIVFDVKESALESFFGKLPFALTDSQKKCLQEIVSDMRSPRPMQRLLQGDVGCGKTVVALLAALGAVTCGWQAAFMVPTEILAQQHVEKICQLLTGLQIAEHREQKKPKIGVLTSSLDDEEKKATLAGIKNGSVDIVIGTHALLEEGVVFHKLGLIVIDEQHKFGVSQRALLPRKGVNPDCLIMTATPIPRTLSLTLYGDLDLSTITQMPAGRGKIMTQALAIEERQKAYDFVREEVKKGRQAYLIYPLVEESEKLELRAAKSMYKEFKDEIFKDLKVGLVYGKMKRDEQEKTMKKFRDGKVDVLVATTVLEVGIDVANATVMVIEHAERFGLSQLHQMRGRIGRGVHESHCLLVADPKSEDAQARIKAFVATTDGFKIAEEDLKIRGPGEFFGERQHGLADLKIADPLAQMHLLKAAREDAHKLIERDPKLADPKNAELKRQLYRRFPEFERFVEVG